MSLVEAATLPQAAVACTVLLFLAEAALAATAEPPDGPDQEIVLLALQTSLFV